MAKEVHKLQQLNKGDTNPHIQQLYRQFTQLANSHNELVDTCNKNFSIYNHQFQVLDVRIGAAFSAVQDLVSSLEKIGNNYVESMLLNRPSSGQDGEVRVDWQKYMQHYLDTVRIEMARLDAARQQARESGMGLEEDVHPTMATPMAEVEPLITPEGVLAEESASAEAPDTVFGGDHAEVQQPSIAT